LEQPFAIGYIGSPADSSTGCRVLGNGYRWYDPALMRFASSDSWSPFDVGGIHPYAYCRDDPINYPEPAFRPGPRLTALKGGVSNRSQSYDE
jgi:RHS repeat-associated protein